MVGIAASLPRDTVGRIIQEVPTAADVRELDAPAGVTVTWIVREDTDAHAVPGRAALAELQGYVPADDHGYAFVVGSRRSRRRAADTCTVRACRSPASPSPASGSTRRASPSRLTHVRVSTRCGRDSV
ncbi:SIP domain-containing protein [Curtobacterium flaccumfaciens]|nr:SIP domain-containing protein [Curtobacterium flaccumfaciens]